MKQKAYAAAGVDIDLGNKVKGTLPKLLASTHRREVLGKVGGFGGLFALEVKKYRQPVLVSSVDGVGTKLKLAFAMDKHDTIGEDLVNHCVNDIAVLGAEPLFFLDYLGTGKLEPHVFTDIIKGFARGCAANGCTLIGGETAQMPGFYQAGEYDLSGTIVGVVEKLKLKVTSRVPGLKGTLGEELLKVHVTYGPLAQALLKRFNSQLSTPNSQLPVRAFAHITGGGFVDNIPRVLPAKCDVVIRKGSWEMGPLFQLLAERGGVDEAELYQVFNMGVGMVAVVAAEQADAALKFIRSQKHTAWLVGEVVKGTGVARVE